MDNNRIPQISSIKFKLGKRGFKLERKYILIAALLIVATVAAMVVYFMFVRTSEPGLDHTKHIYSQNGKLLSIEGDLLTFRIETIARVDGENFANFEEKTGNITDQTAVFKISFDFDDPASLIVESVTLSDIKSSDKIDVRSFQNFLILEEFDIHEIYIQP